MRTISIKNNVAPADASGLLSIRNLNAWYDREKRILSEFSLELQEHEAVGLIGLNGAGKTTFIKKADNRF